MENEIKIDIEMTEDIIKKYNSKMYKVRFLNKRFIPFLIFIIIYMIFLATTKYTIILSFMTGFLLAYFLLIITTNIRSKKMSLKLMELNKDENEYTVIVTDENIKILFKDEDIKNKIKYEQINLVHESKDLIIILHHLSSRALVIPKNSLPEEQIIKIKEILKKKVDSKVLCFSK